MSTNNNERKDRYVKIMLDEADHALLGYKAKIAGMSRSEFARNILYHGNVEIHNRFSPEDTRALMAELCNISNALAQIGYCARLQCNVDEKEYMELERNFKATIESIGEYIAGK